ncbi:MAG: TetR/AcrR family transcriptional regulator [Myxococcota bacterium]
MREPFAGVQRPRPLMAADAERKLTPRQREILDALEALAVQQGFAELTMAELAARVNCSLRTLYGLAPSKDELLLAVVDRRLHRIGRDAASVVEPGMDPLTALRAYLAATNVAVGPTTEALSRELAAVPGGIRLINEHANFIIAVTGKLLDRAVDEGLIDPVDTGALSLILGGLGSYFSRPQVIPLIRESPKSTADAIMDIILRGLDRR